MMTTAEEKAELGGLTFENVDVSVVIKNEKPKPLLSKVSGFVQTGETLAIMGPSGAGKSTLLDFLSHRSLFMRNPRLAKSGKVTLNGDEMTPKLFRDHCALVPQVDALWPSLTVRENLRYSAWFNMPRKLAEEETHVERTINEVVASLGLTSCADVIIGNQFIRGVSKGQARRVSIGVELMQPHLRVLMLDEPTSGLDAAAAYYIMELLVRLARERNLAVVTVIHQPSSRIFHQLDQLLLLSSGRAAYFGPASEALGYFEQLGHEPGTDVNPADFLLDLINTDFGVNNEVGQILDKWSQIETEGSVPDTINTLKELPPPGIPADHTKSKNKHLTMFRRLAISYAKDPALYVARMGNYLVMGLFLSLVHGDMRYDPVDALTRLFFLLWVIAFNCFQASATLPAFYFERTIVSKEIHNGHYGLLVYVAQQGILQIPAIFVLTIFAATPSYFIAGLDNDATKFFRFFLTLFSVLYCNEQLASVLGALFRNFIVGNALYNSLVFTCLLYCGLLIRLEEMPDGWKWLHYISFMKYSFEILARNEFEGAPFEDAEGNPLDGNEVLRTLFPSTETKFYESVDVTQTPIGGYIAVLWAMALLLRVVAYFLLKRRI